MTFTHGPGRSLAICGPRIAILVDLAPSDPEIAQLLTVVADPANTLDEALEVLVQRGLRAVHDFALAEVTDDGSRIVVRGRFTARFGDGEPLIAQGLWTDRLGSPRVVLADQDAAVDAERLPLLHGIVRAGSVSSGDAGSVGVAAPAPTPVQDPADQPQPVADLTAVPTIPDADADESDLASGVLTEQASAEPEVATETEAAPEPEPEPDVWSEPGVLPEGEADGEPQADPDPDQEPQAAAQPDHEPQPDQEADPEPQPAAEGEPAPDPEPVVGESDGDPEPEPQPAAHGTAAGASVDYPHGHTLPSMFVPPGYYDAAPAPDPELAVAAAPPASAAFIDSIPWGPAASPGDETMTPQERPYLPDEEAGDLTINRGSLAAATAPAEGVPTVVAARCDRGHLSPAYAGNCRVCGEALPPQQPFEAPRPALGVLNFSNGEVVVLDRGCVLGRNPRIPAGHTGETPNLVRLNDPDKDISSQHLEVGLDYWHVTVKDLGSTNGTEVVPAGEPATSLRPDDPVTIEPGTTVVLAGVLSFVYEVTG